MKISLKQTNSTRVQLEQEAPFAESCLPLTIELAKRNKRNILPHLPEETKAFPYEDRVLIWLHSTWHANVQQFHRSSGKSMSEMFSESPHKFRRFDDHYSEKLDRWLAEKS